MGAAKLAAMVMSSSTRTISSNVKPDRGIVRLKLGPCRLISRARFRTRVGAGLCLERRVKNPSYAKKLALPAARPVAKSANRLVRRPHVRHELLVARAGGVELVRL